MTLLIAALAAVAAGAQPPAQQPPQQIFARDVSDEAWQAAYRACGDSCSVDAGCGSWDWDPTTSACHLEAERSSPPSLAGRPPPTQPPTYDPATQKLIAKYEAEKNATCATVLPQVPTLDAKDAADFMAAYQAYMGNASEATVITAAKKLMTPALDAFLSLPDSFAAADGLDAAMVKCTVMTQASQGTAVEKGAITHLLALFAAQGQAQEALVEQLLGDTALMRDLLVAGGPAATGVVNGRYGETMAIYAELVKQSSALRATIAAGAPPAAGPWDDRDPATVLKRLALGVALALAVPLEHRWATNLPNDTKYVDPVARYLHYEHAYLAGELDPAFPVLTTFEIAHAMDSDALEEDISWVRSTLANYRPDEIAMPYHWRYAWTVHSDVAYGDSSCPTFPGVCQGHYSDIPVGGDVCGGRAFWGRFARKSFGIPTWGATEHGHAAMSSWNPTGWNVMMGSSWPWTWWGDRGGEDFSLEALCRENRTEFQKVLRGGWAAMARGETPVDQRWDDKLHTYTAANGKGGLWSALMLYKKKLVVNATVPMNRSVPVAANNKIQALIHKFGQPTPPVSISTGPDGTITIPATAFSSDVNSSAPASGRQHGLSTAPLYNAPFTVMPSWDAGAQVLSYPWNSTTDEDVLSYKVTAATAGSFYLTANFTTYHMNQDLNVSVNGGASVKVPVFYTVGWWNQTQPVELELAKGSNTLAFTRNTTRELVFKEFFLYAKEPVVPKPNGSFYPVPAPPPPNDYIEESAGTNCFKQGIENVPGYLCAKACAAVGLKPARGENVNRPNISGCFVPTTGKTANTCFYNTNASATCEPPCTLDGAVVRMLCIRN